jgi:hypothetical protein
MQLTYKIIATSVFIFLQIKLARKKFNSQGKENSSISAQGLAQHTVKKFFLGIATSMADSSIHNI